MENHIFNIGLGYLLGLGLHGYVLIWYVIKEVGRKSAWPIWGTNVLIALHFIAGLTAMLFVPSIYFKNYEGQDSTIGGILFSVPALTMLFISLCIAQYWNSLLETDNDAANEAGIPKNRRRDFGVFIEKIKREEGRGGRDDFTFGELCGLAKEFKDTQC